MTTPPVHVITKAPRPRRKSRRLRGLHAVAVLLVTAADDLLSALTGRTPARTVARALAAPVADAYRRGSWYPRPDAPVTRPDQEGSADDGTPGDD